NRHFLNALVRDEGLEELGCCVPDQQNFQQLCTLVSPIRPVGKKISYIPFGDHASLSRAGALHKYDPTIASLLWQRRFVDQRLYSVVGIIHSISSQAIMESIGNLLVAPFQPWDALICTSKAGKDAVTTMLGNWADYLAQRFNARFDINIKLPIIPLGI